jgi:hypothetical protein
VEEEAVVFVMTIEVVEIVVAPCLERERGF